MQDDNQRLRARLADALSVMHPSVLPALVRASTLWAPASFTLCSQTPLDSSEISNSRMTEPPAAGVGLQIACPLCREVRWINGESVHAWRSDNAPVRRSC